MPKPTRQAEPRGLERSYLRDILRLLLHPAQQLVDELLIPRLPEFDAELVADAYPEAIESIFGDITLRYGQIVTGRTIKGVASDQAAQLDLFNRKQTSRQFEQILGIDVFGITPELTTQINAFTVDNVKLIESIPAKYFQEIENTALRNLRAGNRASEWRGELEERYDVSESRAALIARDQTNKFNGELNHTRQTDLGIDGYTWRTSEDERVRESHVAINGNPYAWEGEPSPPEGHPGHPIQCFPGDTVVSVPGGASRVFRRWYEGDLVVMHSKAGALRCTPNHPILTVNGWRSAKELNKGDHIIQATLDAAGLRDDDRHEASFDEMWDFASRVGSSYARTSGFHGDSSPDHKVDVIDIDGHLSLDRPSLCAECLEQLTLTVADDSGSRLGQIQAMGPRLGDATHGIVGGSRTRAPFGSGHAPLHCEHCFGSTPRLSSILVQPPRKNGPRNHSLGGERLRGLPPGVSFHQLTEAPRRVKFFGHVFNLESCGGWYIAATVAVHNCRCQAEPDVEGVLERLGV